MSDSLMSPTRSVPRRGVARVDLLVRGVVFAALVIVTPIAVWTLWLAGQIGGLVTGLTWPDSTPGDAPGIAVRLLGHAGHPGAAWPARARADVPGAAVVYGLWLLLLGGAVFGLLALVARLVRRFGRRRGFATRRDLRRLSAQAMCDRAPVLRPALTVTDRDTVDEIADKQRRAADPLEMSRCLGVDAQSGETLYAPLNWAEVVRAPPQSGKTTQLVIPRILDTRGALITTSTRLDVVPPTWAARNAVGPTYIFEPQGTLPGVPRLRWSPIWGAENRLAAILRANGFAAAAGLSGGNVENGQFFTDAAAGVLRALLHAAALDGTATMTDVAAWGRNRRERRPERILHAHGASDWAEDLTSHRLSTSRTVDNVEVVVRQALDCFSDPRVLDACSPVRGQELDPLAWLAESGTIYMVGDRSSQASVAPLLTAMIEDIAWRATQKAFVAVGGKCDPNLVLLLDEIANIAPLPSAASLMSEGGGSGLGTSIIAQNDFQLLDRFGQYKGPALVLAGNVHVLLGGGTDVKALRDFQSLAGKIREAEHGTSWGSGRTSHSAQVRREDLIDLAELHALPYGRALVIAGNLAPVEVITPAWFEREDALALRQSEKQFRDLIAGGW
ncbi:TraM recognition domain-containing protein [Longispora sp. NPDC051575]|uniref:type IV secretory system conjugative DNA transfer family protein n=1 Tax=Longispora sp. NPDC051575 TaxID=3154943 RepID=UPI003430CBC0